MGRFILILEFSILTVAAAGVWVVMNAPIAVYP